MTDRLPRMLRADARDNRDRVLDAARAAFAERGLDVPMREIARLAEVGPATLYRRFPTKQALIDAAFDDEMRACAAIVERGSRDEDPWRGLRATIEELLVRGSRNRGFVEAFTASRRDADAFAEHRTTLLRVLAELVVRARARGGLRAGIVVDDIVLVLLAGRGLASVDERDRDAAARRLAALAIVGFAADADADERLPRPARVAPPAVRRP